MKNEDIKKTRVIFRKYKPKHNFGRDGVILALFPDIPFTTARNTCQCYEFCEQHGEADYGHVVNVMTVKANPEEYKELKEHLENDFGYRFDVRQKRINRSR